ncbi:hypothetical protein cyc_08733 [Cyclospora cayetanensis]|uniref:Uncharacterized protein n=1 Tax=Cyclospora cayetanensis TaxID=88456 RepID=A0A1D3D1U3_9EIME|nr:hypothetical protein cyc_08733 [Cyclospora cayetanensis]
MGKEQQTKGGKSFSVSFEPHKVRGESLDAYEDIDPSVCDAAGAAARGSRSGSDGAAAAVVSRGIDVIRRHSSS